MQLNFSEWLFKNSDAVIVVAGCLIACGIILLFVNIAKSLYRRYARKIYRKVARISKNFEHLRRLSSKYSIAPLNNYKYNIVAPVRSLQKYRKTFGEDVVGYYVERNIDGLRDDIALAIKTAQCYHEYIQEVDSLNFETNIDLFKQEGLSQRKFKKYEQKLITRKVIKDPTSIIVKIEIYYSSPRGRNVYQKTGKYNYDALVYIYKGWLRKRNYKISARYERSLMSDSLRYDVLRRDNFQCCICGATRKDGARLHVDHIIPVSKGGKTTMSNLQTLCERCNLGKSNKL